MLKRAFLRWAIGLAAIALTVWLMGFLPKHLQLRWNPAWWIAIYVPVFAVVNAVIGGIVRVCALPINCMTLGLFGFVINATMFEVAGRLTHAQTGDGKPIGFVVSLIGSILYTALSAPLSAFVKEHK